MGTEKNCEQRWAQRIAEQEASGLGVTVWCRREGVIAERFYSWRRRLRGRSERRRGEAARQHWARLLDEQERSGQSVAAFCRERGLCAPHFFAWKKRLAPEPAGSGFVAVQVRDEAAATEPLEPAPIEVRLRGGRSLLVPAGFERGHLLRLVAALEALEVEA